MFDLGLGASGFVLHTLALLSPPLLHFLSYRPSAGGLHALASQLECDLCDALFHSLCGQQQQTTE